MTVRQLRDILNELPGDAQIVVQNSSTGEFADLNVVRQLTAEDVTHPSAHPDAVENCVCLWVD